MPSKDNTNLILAVALSVAVHGLLLMVLSWHGSVPSSPPTFSALEVHLVDQLEVTSPLKTSSPQHTESISTAASEHPLERSSETKESSSSEPSPIPTTWIPLEAAVKSFPEIPLPPETASATGYVELEIELDHTGKPTVVTVKKESPPGFFAEWGWSMGMQGTYTPKITRSGPVPSVLRVRLDITGGGAILGS